MAAKKAAVKKVAKKAATKTAARKVAGKAARPKQLRFDSVSKLKQYIEEEVRKDEYRMVPKVAPAPKPEKEPEVEDVVTAEGAWGRKPSVARQLEVHPTTVRGKASVSAQFILSDPDQMKAWNALQARMHPTSAPEIKLGAYESEFAPAISSYVILVTYSELEYQQLI